MSSDTTAAPTTLPATSSGASPLTGRAAVAAIYEAFGRGDVPTFLSLLADDVSWDADWADNWGQRTRLDHFTPRRGRAGVAEFLATLAAGYTVHDVQVLDLASSDRQVVAQVVIDLELPNGGRLRDEELHLWTFGPDGRVRALRHYVDTAKHLAAGRGVDTTR
jgi:ketosteroid isomerase-like protein